MRRCPKCKSPNWDYTDVGIPYVILCTDCGHIYNSKGKQAMTESEFEDRFDRGEFDCEFAMWISETYDAWGKHQMLKLWEDPDVYVAFMETTVTEPSTALQDAYFDGKHPLDSFPTLKGN